MTRKKNPKKKLEIIFDAKKRREFLTGFHKRKNERRKRAKEELERNLKEERKRIRQEIKDGVKLMKKSFEPLKELSELDKASEDEYEDDDVKVKIIELSRNDLAVQRNMLGENLGKNSEDSEIENSDGDENNERSENYIPGMDFELNVQRKPKILENGTESEDNSVDDNYDKKLKKSSAISIQDIKSKKELDHFKKTKVMKMLKKSKVFKMKERLVKRVNQKKAHRDRNNAIKSLPKHLRKKKFDKNPYSKGRKLNKKQIRRKNEK